MREVAARLMATSIRDTACSTRSDLQCRSCRRRLTVLFSFGQLLCQKRQQVLLRRGKAQEEQVLSYPAPGLMTRKHLRPCWGKDGRLWFALP
jgi:hypothetical protein